MKPDTVELSSVSVLLVTGRALDRVQGSGEKVQLLGELCMNSVNTAHGARIVGFSFTVDAQASKLFERCVREHEGQSTHVVVKAGIVINGVEEHALRDHLVMHSAPLESHEKLKQEAFDIARAKSALGTASTSIPMLFVVTKARVRTRARVKITARKEGLSGH